MISNPKTVLIFSVDVNVSAALVTLSDIFSGISIGIVMVAIILILAA